MTAVLTTGRSGTGKSTVLAAPAGRGHRTVDTDEDDLSEEVALLAGYRPPSRFRWSGVGGVTLSARGALGLLQSCLVQVAYAAGQLVARGAFQLPEH